MKRKKEISLIILIVTMIVIIILAAAVILTINKNNPVSSAKEAIFKEDIRSFQDDLSLSVSKDYTSNTGQRNNKFNATELKDIQIYIPSFTKKYEGKLVINDGELKYVGDKVTEKEKKWLDDLDIKQILKSIAEKISESPKEYYGKSITNYVANGISDWKIFYSDGNNIYLISSDYVDVEKLPSPSNTGGKPVNTNSNYPKQASLDNVFSVYSGSDNITDDKIKKLNSDYFNKKYTSTSTNMKKVAYMLDTKIWSEFKTENAEYVIGGPTIEMLIQSYNQIHDTKYNSKASSDVGYEISKDGGENWNSWWSYMLDKNDSLYVLPKSNGATGMWISSPCFGNTSNVFYTRSTGNVGGTYFTDFESDVGFRPIVCLNSNVNLVESENGFFLK